MLSKKGNLSYFELRTHRCKRLGLECIEQSRARGRPAKVKTEEGWTSTGGAAATTVGNTGYKRASMQTRERNKRKSAGGPKESKRKKKEKFLSQQQLAKDAPHDAEVHFLPSCSKSQKLVKLPFSPIIKCSILEQDPNLLARRMLRFLFMYEKLAQMTQFFIALSLVHAV